MLKNRLIAIILLVGLYLMFSHVANRYRLTGMNRIITKPKINKSKPCTFPYSNPPIKNAIGLMMNRAT